MTTTPKSEPDITGMAAVLLGNCPINRKLITAVKTGALMVGSPVHLIHITVPPLHPALVRAELLLLPPLVLCHFLTAAFTVMLIICLWL